DEVVGARGLSRIVDAMDRASDQEPGRRESRRRVDRYRGASQVYAMGAAGQRDVETIVDHDPCRAASGHGEKIARHRSQIGGFEVVLAKLDEIDPGGNRVLGLGDETFAGDRQRRVFTRQPSSIGDETDHQTCLPPPPYLPHPPSVVASSPGSRGPRSANSSARSAKPANRLTMP